MNYCSKCGSPLIEGTKYCTNCGAPANRQGNVSESVVMDYIPQPFDHTSEFDRRDISNNKVLCMAMYLLGIPGMILALLAGQNSKYTQYHFRWVLRMTVLDTLTAIATLVLCWTIIVPIAAVIWLIIMFVIRIICFVRICMDKACDPPIIRSIQFMR